MEEMVRPLLTRRLPRWPNTNSSSVLCATEWAPQPHVPFQEPSKNLTWPSNRGGAMASRTSCFTLANIPPCPSMVTSAHSWMSFGSESQPMLLCRHSETQPISKICSAVIFVFFYPSENGRKSRKPPLKLRYNTIRGCSLGIGSSDAIRLLMTEAAKLLPDFPSPALRPKPC